MSNANELLFREKNGNSNEKNGNNYFYKVITFPISVRDDNEKTLQTYLYIVYLLYFAW